MVVLAMAALTRAQALGAAARIRDTCFGADHPWLAASTLVAAERAAKNAARLASAAAPS